MSQNKMLQLLLPENYVGQIIDGVEVLAEQWEQTVEFLENGICEGDDVVIHECRDASEARTISTLLYPDFARNSRANVR